MRRLLLILLTILSGCSSSTEATLAPQDVLIVAEIKDQDGLEFAQTIVDSATKQVSLESKFHFATLNPDGLHVVHSSTLDEAVIRGLNQSLKATGIASKTSLIDALTWIGTTCRDRRDQPLRAILVTSGTSDEAVLKSMSDVATSSLMPCSNLKLAVVGLSPKNSIPTTATLHSIRNRVVSGRSEGESRNVIQSFLE
ncbi:hypothetical protein H6F89_34430 [Cyanobacteria bacterium FACHB-63]|nr:hypothetical protein [Cyanobacteria bacterium FACHB-63]